MKDIQNRNRIWITWETQRRNRTLSKALNAELYEFDIKSNRLLRYVKATYKTFRTIIKKRVSLIIAQNPSIVLSFFAVTLGRVLGKPVVVDAHNSGVFPFEGRVWWTNVLANYIFRAATLTIVTNEGLREHVNLKGGKGFVLQDPIPIDLPEQSRTIDLKGRYNILFICTYASDEPYKDVIRAASMVDNETVIYVTGNPRGKEREFQDYLPSNVVITGFLAEQDFINLLRSVDVIMDLTTRNNCLICGAYEAVALGKPMIISDTEALRNYFSKGALYSDNTSHDIANKIKLALNKKEQLAVQVESLKRDLIADWANRKKALEKILKDI